MNNLKLRETQLEDKISSAKSMYENNLIYQLSTSNNSRIYKIRSVTWNSSIPLTVDLDSVHATADLVKASLFNTHFHFIFTHSSFELPSLESLSTPLVLRSLELCHLLIPLRPMVLGHAFSKSVPMFFTYHSTISFA